jgi:RNA polymerase sigma-70 factor (ECF subfamily)
MNTLDDRSRTVLLLSFEAESGTDEIAEFIGISTGNVRTVRHRAITQLRRCLDGDKGTET